MGGAYVLVLRSGTTVRPHDGEEGKKNGSDSKPSWLHQVVGRRYVVISGALAWLAGSGLLGVSRDVVTQPFWQPFITSPMIADGLYISLLLNGFVLIPVYLMTLRQLSRQPEQREKIEKQWWASPILFQMLFFMVHWMTATFYTLVTSQAVRGAALGLVSGLHILVVLLLGFRFVLQDPD